MKKRTLTFPCIAFVLLVVTNSSMAAPYDEALDAFRKGDFSEAKRLWSIGASQGDVESQLQLGIMFAAGKHVSKDIDLAKSLLLSASEKGNIEARVALALLYFDKRSGNSAKGLELLRSAAANGSKNAASLIKIGENIDLGILGFHSVAIEQELLIPVRFADKFLPSPKNVAAGKATTEQVCSACHKSGLAGAPKAGHSVEWRERMHVGIDELAARSIRGYKACPPRGGNYMLTDEEIRAAVYYMAPKRVEQPVNSHNLCSRTRETQINLVDSAVLDAVKRGDTETLEAAFRAGVSVNGTSHEGFSLLHLAITEHQDSVIALLIRRGADVNQPFMGSSPLSLAMTSSAGAQADRLRERALREAGATLSDFDIAFEAVRKLRRGSLQQGFVKAITEGNMSELELYARATYDINGPLSDGIAPIHIAAIQGTPGAVRYLVQCGGDVNARTKRGAPVLWFAKDRPEISALLITLGAEQESRPPK